MAATDTLRGPLRRATYRTLIGLLAVSGMRVGEAIGLDRVDIDLAAGCVTVRGGKPGAGRELPLHASTLRALREYCRVREEHWPRPTSPAFFLVDHRHPVDLRHRLETFRGLLVEAGLGPRRRE